MTFVKKFLSYRFTLQGRFDKHEAEAAEEGRKFGSAYTAEILKHSRRK